MIAGSHVTEGCNGVNTKDIKGLPAVSAADGEKIGQVERAYLHLEERRVVGFAIGTGAHLFSTESSRMVDTSEIQAIGHDLLTLPDATSAQGQETTTRYGELIDLEDLTRRQIYTEGGTLVGGVASAEFDPHSYAWTSIEAGPGHFKKHTTIPVDQIVTVGPEFVIVRNDVSTGDAAPVPSLEEKPASGPAHRPDELDIRMSTIG